MNKDNSIEEQKWVKGNKLLKELLETLPPNQMKFLLLRLLGNDKHTVCLLLGLSPKLPQQWRFRDKHFKEMEKLVLETAKEAYESQALPLWIQSVVTEGIVSTGSYILTESDRIGRGEKLSSAETRNLLRAQQLLAKLAHDASKFN